MSNWKTVKSGDGIRTLRNEPYEIELLYNDRFMNFRWDDTMFIVFLWKTSEEQAQSEKLAKHIFHNEYAAESKMNELKERFADAGP